jgi:nucleotide-binding universal stress UspA family protein
VNDIDEVRQVLDQVVPQLQEKGYTVYLEPSRDLVPSFLEGYRPDAIALRADKNLAIEVLVEGSAAKSREERLKQRFKDRSDWELRVYYVRPIERRSGLPVMTREAIDASLTSIEKLVASGPELAALVVGWATFEALGRALSPDKFARAQSPARLIEVLASDGSVTPSEADFLRTLANLRNRTVHGIVDQKVDRADLVKFLTILKSLRKLLA